MTDSTEPTKDKEVAVRSVLDVFHCVLNAPGVAPEKCYRRNMASYTLVCYVNNIVALYLSEHYEPIPVFVTRAAQHMQEFPSAPVTERYYGLVFKYLAHMTYFVCNFTNVATPCDIPEAIQSAGPQEAPNNSFKADGSAAA